MSQWPVISFSKLEEHVQHGDLTTNWMTFGTITKKKINKKTKNACLWKLNDLQENSITVSMFLSKNVYPSFRDLDVGADVAILRPTVVKSKKDKQNMKFYVKSIEQIIKLGQSNNLSVYQYRSEILGINSELKLSTAHTLQLPANEVPEENEMNFTQGSTNAFEKELFGVIDKTFCDMVASEEPEIHIDLTESQKNIYSFLNEVVEEEDIENDEKVYFINKNETATDAKSEVYYDKENYHLLEKFLMDSCMINNLENTNMDCHPTQNISDEEMDCDMNQNISDEKMDCHLNQNISDSNFEEMDCHQNQRDEEMDCHLNQNISDEEMDCDLKQNTSDEKEKNSINEDSRGKLNSKKHKRTKGEQSETPNYIQKIVEENSSSKCSPTSKVNPNCTGDQNIIQKTLLDELFDSMQGETCNLEKEGQQPKNSVPSTKGIEKTLKENGYLPDCLEETEDKCLEKYFPKLCAISCKSETSKNYEIPCKVFRCVVCKYTWFQLFDLCRIKRHEFKVSNGKKCYFRCTNCSRPIIYPKVTISFKCSKCGKKEWERIALISIL